MNELEERLLEIENIINSLLSEKVELKKRLQKIRYNEQLENPKVHLREIKEKYIVANTRVADKVYSVYLGKKQLWGGDSWRNNKKLKEKAVKEMRLKLKKKLS